MNRSIDGLELYEDDVDRRAFLTELRDGTSRHSIEVHAYALMTNHYHLLLHTLNGGLSQAMQGLSSKFTQAANRRRGRDGPLFRGRFASILIRGDAHLMNVCTYIHLNPVSAGLISKPEDWAWSSARAYFGSATTPDWLRTDVLLRMLAGVDNARQRALSGSDPSQQRPQ